MTPSAGPDALEADAGAAESQAWDILDRIRPKLQIQAGQLHKLADDAERHLVQMDIDFFTRGEGIYRPIIETQVDSAGRVTHSSALVQVDAAYLRDVLSEAIRWEKYNKQERKWLPADPPRDVVEIMLASRGEWMFRPIGGIISTPTLRPDGSVLSEPGYDEATRLYVASQLVLPPMPMRPTRGDAEAALDLLYDLLIEFPFADEPSRSVALSAMITPVARGAMDVAPCHASRAPVAGSGKSYLFDTASAIAAGCRCPVMSAGRNEEETEKRLGAKALAGHPIINIDNVNGELGGDSLCQIIERPICEIRVLGSSQMPKIVNRFCVFATGNNITLVGDMTRRTLLCSLDPATEKPGEKQFRGDPVATVLADRAKYVAACLTIVRAYIAAGRPRVIDTPMNSFGMWSATVRSALVWLGCADPVLTVQKARDEDPQLQLISQFIGAMREEVGVGKNWSATTAELAVKAEQMAQAQDENGYAYGEKFLKHPLLNAALAEFRQGVKLNARQFGKWLHKSQMRVVDGLRINSIEDGHSNVKRWFVERVR